MGRTPNVPSSLKRRPFTLGEGLAEGLTRESLRSNCWRRLGSELYCWIGWAEDPWELLSAWERRLPSDAVFAGLTAAWLHRLDVNPLNPIEVIVPPASGLRSRSGLVVRRCVTSDNRRVRGLRTTSPERTFRDLRRRLSRPEFLVLADQALRLGMGRFDERAEPAESPMETRLRWLLLEAGLPSPEVQRELRDADGGFIGRADLFYPAARLVIEYDGVNHRSRLIEDNRRQNLLIQAGLRLLRFTAADLERPGVVAVQVRTALGLGQSVVRTVKLRSDKNGLASDLPNSA